ncbi:MAG: Fumarylacetoacetate hydrolase family protein [Gammaproteobacteria bacterium]|jgi:2-keto-4-pentenoate hydratase/2-oxohepta-3-ene-1,7-dioic acid hydratase in catechol pathway|nr:Fumarylacetoacetate hydrolase family protein [Gammaproteobacteria bacterium]
MLFYTGLGPKHQACEGKRYKDIKSKLMRIFCIGRNYAEHTKELGNAVPKQPVVFMKPYESIVLEGQPIIFPKHGKLLQHEVEVVVKIGQSGRASDAKAAKEMIGSLALGLDLTLRDVQNELKNQGLPWEKAKAFECSAPLGSFVDYSGKLDLANIEFECKVNNELRQKGNTGQMLFSIEQLIICLSSIWSLQAGDLIYTGTPSGVGAISPGDLLELSSPELGQASWKVI